MASPFKKRVRVTRKPSSCPNPLFEKWLQELKDDAAKKESRLQYTYGKALKSLQKYPLVLHSGKECKVLKHFGDVLCQIIEKKLAQHLANGGTVEEENESSDDEPLPPKKVQKKSVSSTTLPKTSQKKEYIPTPRSGAYALLKALYEHMDTEGYLGKKELQEAAQPYADCSFTQTTVNERYLAWSSMSGLIKKGLVEKKGNPARFSLTDSGVILAVKMEEAEFEIQTGGFTSPSNFETNSHSSSSFQCLSTSSAKKKFPEKPTEAEYVPSSRFLKPDPPSFKGLVKPVDDIILLDDDDEFDDVTPLSFEPATIRSSINLQKSNDKERDFSPVQASTSSFQPATSSKPAKPVSSNVRNICENARDVPVVPSTNQLTQIRDRYLPPVQVEPQRNRIATVDEDSNPDPVGTETTHETITLKPGQYEVVLCVDVAEVSGSSKSSNQKESASKAFQNCDIPIDFRKLAVGDYLWICRSKDNSGKELVLPFVVERKRLDDLVSSIKDGRFKEQKFRLKNSGLSRPIYLVEEYSSRQNLGFPEASLMQAIANTLIIERFQVHWTKNSADSISYLVRMTKQIIKMYQGKTVTSRPCQVKPKEWEWQTKLIAFQDFALNSNKQKPLSITNMFAKQLMQLHGLSGEKAEGIVAVYPTPASLMSALIAAGSSASQLLAKIEYGKSRRTIGPSLSSILTKLYTEDIFDV